MTRAPNVVALYEGATENRGILNQLNNQANRIPVKITNPVDAENATRLAKAVRSFEELLKSETNRAADSSSEPPAVTRDRESILRELKAIRDRLLRRVRQYLARREQDSQTS